MKQYSTKKMIQWFENSKIRQIVFFLCAITGLFLVHILALSIIQDKKLKEQNAIIDLRILAEIEDVTIQNGNITFSGWGLHLDAENSGIRLLLKDSTSDAAFLVDAELYSRTEIEHYFQLSTSGNIGFNATIKNSKLNQQGSYELFFVLSYLMDGEEMESKIALNRYWYDGRLYSYNPLVFEQPKIKDKQLMECLEQANVCSYSQEKGIWVYEKNGIMYWLLDEIYVPSLEETSGIPWILYTNELGNYMHYAIYFNEMDLIEGNDTNYYFAKRELPIENQITYIETGNWANSTGWTYRTWFQIFKFEEK